jgi:hypothetical protein
VICRWHARDEMHRRRRIALGAVLALVFPLCRSSPPLGKQTVQAPTVPLDELLAGLVLPASPVNDAAFGPPDGALLPSNRFDGVLALQQTDRIVTQILKDDTGYGRYVHVHASQARKSLHVHASQARRPRLDSSVLSMNVNVTTLLKLKPYSQHSLQSISPIACMSQVPITTTITATVLSRVSCAHRLHWFMYTVGTADSGCGQGRVWLAAVGQYHAWPRYSELCELVIALNTPNQRERRA